MQLIKTFLYFQDIVIFAFGSIKIKNVWSAANYDNIMVIRHTTDISPIAVPNFLLKGPNTHAMLPHFAPPRLLRHQYPPPPHTVFWAINISCTYPLHQYIYRGLAYLEVNTSQCRISRGKLPFEYLCHHFTKDFCQQE